MRSLDPRSLERTLLCTTDLWARSLFGARHAVPCRIYPTAGTPARTRSGLVNKNAEGGHAQGVALPLRKRVFPQMLPASTLRVCPFM